jgi:hypothetical protein
MTVRELCPKLVGRRVYALTREYVSRNDVSKKYTAASWYKAPTLRLVERE